MSGIGEPPGPAGDDGNENPEVSEPDLLSEFMREGKLIPSCDPLCERVSRTMS